MSTFDLGATALTNLPVEDAVAVEALENAGRLYQRYLELARLSARRALVSGAPKTAVFATFGSLETSKGLTHADVE